MPLMIAVVQQTHKHVHAHVRARRNMRAHACQHLMSQTPNLRLIS